MINNEVSMAIEKLEEISAALVSADVSDLQALAQIHTLFQELDLSLEQTEMKDRARCCSDLIERIILQECSATESIQKLTDSVAGMKKRLLKREYSPTESQESGEILRGKQQPELLMDEEIFELFLSRQESVMEELENEILQLERGQGTEEIRRVMHTLKGEAGALGLIDIEKLCHTTEDYLDRKETRACVEELLQVKDWLCQSFRMYAGKGTLSCGVDTILALLKVEKDDTKSYSEELPVLPHVQCADSDLSKGITIAHLGADPGVLEDFIHEARDHLQKTNECLIQLESIPEDVELINELFRIFHTIKGIAGFLGLDAIQLLSHATESLLAKARDREIVLNAQCIEAVFSSVDALQREIESLCTCLNTNGTYHAHSGIHHLITDIDRITSEMVEGRQKIGELLIDQGKVTPGELKSALCEQLGKPGKRIGELLVEHGIVSSQDVTDALNLQSGKPKSIQVREKIKVDTEKLDRLVDIIGELVITEAMIAGDNKSVDYGTLESKRNLRQLNKITRQLQEIGLSMRMVSLKSTFQKMARLVRDLARKAGKEINFVTSGEETELDKTVIEHIGDPLIHMVRNSADHGIESVEERIRAGKPEAGTISLRAYQKGGTICIEVEDDGRGLNRDAITKKALEKGLLRETEILADQDLFQLIFNPGFSTAQKITDISGRGVGMDVVKRNIEALRGTIDIYSKQGSGTVFTIHLPLTLAIIDGMVVEVGGERYIIPIVSILESFCPQQKDFFTVFEAGEMVRYHGALIPVVRLSELFSVHGAKTKPDEGIIIVMQDAEKRIGLLVDSILGQQQTVVKHIGGGIGTIKGISGAAIMPDGHVSLIIDVTAVMKHNERASVYE